MAIKKQSLEEKIDQAADRFESSAETWASGVERKVVTWLRTSQFFDGLVNTPARIIINVLSILALYVVVLLAKGYASLYL